MASGILSTEMKTWMNIPEGSDFPIQNLPYGIFTYEDHNSPRAGVAIGNMVLDLSAIQEAGLLSVPGLPWGVFSKSTLNSFIGLGKEITNQVRERIAEILELTNTELKDN